MWLVNIAVEVHDVTNANQGPYYRKLRRTVGKYLGLHDEEQDNQRGYYPQNR